MTRDCVCPRARHSHGQPGAYRYDGCRCQPCTDAVADVQRRRRRAIAYGQWGDRWATAVGTNRRMQALFAAGWSCTQLAPHLGVSPNAVVNLRTATATQTRVLRTTADRVAYTYDRLWHVTPTGRYQERSSRHAERAGWAAPWQWEGVDIDDPAAQPLSAAAADGLDMVLVERIVSGCHDVRPNSHRYRLEVAEAVRVLAGRGMTDAEVGRRIGKNRDAVCQIRHRYGIASRSPQPSKDAA